MGSARVGADGNRTSVPPDILTPNPSPRSAGAGSLSHLAATPREFVDALIVGRRRLGGERGDIAAAVPDWWVAGHRREPTGRPPGRPKGAKDTAPRKYRGVG